MDIIIFGAGKIGRQYCRHLMESPEKNIRVKAFADNNAELHGSRIMDIPVVAPADIAGLVYDQVAVSIGVLPWLEEALKQLAALGVRSDKIDVLLYSFNLYDEETDPRVVWTRNFAEYVHQLKMPGQVAECGVFRGEYSVYLNKYFHDRKLYLFDTFEGFPVQDLEFEKSMKDGRFLDGEFSRGRPFSDNSVDIVKRRLPAPDRCLISPGYFPQSAEGLEQEFCFVCLDMDLYKPTLSGLEFFWEKMVPGGVILVHDYFHPELPGARLAVDEFQKSIQTRQIPIGDSCSLAIIK